MTWTALLLILAGGCDLLPGGKPEQNAPGGEPTEPVAPAAPSLEDRLAEAGQTALSGKHALALASLEKLIVENPTHSTIWRLMGQEAIASGNPRELYDRLDASEAIVGQEGPHQLLRAELALAAGLGPETLAAAQAVRTVDPDAAAALIAQAARMGVPGAVPDPPPAEPLADEALALFAVSTDEKAGAPYVEAASAVTGWRAALLRAEVFVAHGQVARALDEYERATTADDPRARVRANLGRARVALATPLPGVAGAVEAAGWAADAANAALAEYDSHALVDAADLAVQANLAAVCPDEAVRVVSALVEAAAGTGETEARLSLALARASLAAGRVVDARAAAEKARQGLGDLADAVAEAGWLQGLAAHAVGDGEAVDEAAAAQSGPRKDALRALALMDQGRAQEGLALVQTAGLEDRDRVLLLVEAARFEPDKAAEWLNKAVAAADRTGDLRLRVSTRLDLEERLRGKTPATARKVRSDLLAMAPEGEAGLGLKAEVAVRAMLAGEPGTALSELAPPPAVVRVWSSLAQGVAVSDAETVPWASGVAAWAGVRAALIANDAAGAARAGEVLGSLPVHRRGALATGTVLDGSRGLPVGVELAAAAAWDDEASLGLATACHELGHRLDAYEADELLGRDFLAGAQDELRVDLAAATQRVRAVAITWALTGEGPLDEAMAALAEAEAKAFATPGMAVLAPVAAPSVADLRTVLAGAALLSYSRQGGDLYGLVVTPDGGGQRLLGNTAEIFSLAATHRAALVRAAEVDDKADFRAGDRLRMLLIDPFSAELTGFGRYLVLGPDALLTFPVTTFPEQSSGLRYLADIRSVATAPSLQAIRSRGEVQAAYKPDYLALANPSPATAAAAGGEQPAEPAQADDKKRKREETPGDVGSASRHFSTDFREIRTGVDATIAAYEQLAGSSRYVHFSAVPAAPDGGFVLADGVLTLSRVRDVPIQAQIVIVTAPATPAQQLHRARAFLDAGARGVMVGGWPIPEKAAERLVDGFFEALNQDRTPLRAISEARGSLISDAMLGPNRNDPALWGTYLLISAP